MPAMPKDQERGTLPVPRGFSHDDWMGNRSNLVLNQPGGTIQKTNDGRVVVDENADPGLKLENKWQKPADGTVYKDGDPNYPANDLRNKDPHKLVEGDTALTERVAAKTDNDPADTTESRDARQPVPDDVWRTHDDADAWAGDSSDIEGWDDMTLAQKHEAAKASQA